MSGRISHEAVLTALSVRYDYQSARAILHDALDLVGLQEAESYSPEELSRIVWGLNQMGERAQAAVMALLELAGNAATADLDDEEEDLGEGGDLTELSMDRLRDLARKIREQARVAKAEADGHGSGKFWN